jgi:hypothetical protein
MSTEPLVVCVCLTKDRPAMLNRAIACYGAQTYENKILLIVNSGEGPLWLDDTPGAYNVWEPCFVGADAMTIGALRNEAGRWIASGPTPFPDIIVHWDDDDWSHPSRIAEQVTLLQSSVNDCVGYREMLFCRDVSVKEDRISQIADPSGNFRVIGHHWREAPSEAWLYTSGKPSYCLGTSLCYWRRAWEKRPFEDLAHGEDHAWLKGVDSLGVSSLANATIIDEWFVKEPGASFLEPRMIATIHGGNTSPAYQHLEACEKQGEKWKRVPQWDEYCRATMEAYPVERPDTSKWRMTEATNE